jgi:hypothetical protein
MNTTIRTFGSSIDPIRVPLRGELLRPAVIAVVSCILAQFVTVFLLPGPAGAVTAKSSPRNLKQTDNYVYATVLNDTVARWDFNEASGDSAYDQSGNGHHGKLNGPSWVPGVSGHGLEYDGDDYVTVEGGTWLTQSKGTVEAWVSIDPVGTGGRIISTETFGWHNGFHMNWGTQLSNNQYINGGIYGGIHSTEGSDHYVEAYIDDVSKGPWHFVAFVWDGDADSLLVFVDGVTNTVISAHQGIVDTGEPLTIGCWEDHGSHGGWFQGSVDEVRFYDRALSVAELNAHYSGSSDPIALQCPHDTLVPAFSTIPQLLLSGFEFTNTSAASSAFEYYLTASGPATLVDNGNPASLSGTTPLLSPGESYLPPEAALEVAQIREWTQQFVDYHVHAVGYPEVADSCTTTITFEPPVPVFVTAFDAVPLESSVELRWDIGSDGDMKGFRIYRSTEGSQSRDLLNSENLVPPQARKYMDRDVWAGRSYDYTLGVVLMDDSEVLSHAVSVKTKSYELALYQNHPNPFNPTTTISFTLPERVHVNLSIYNIEGKLIKRIAEKSYEAGYQEVSWDGTENRGNNVGSGVYFYRLKAGKKVLTKKMVLLK